MDRTTHGHDRVERSGRPQRAKVLEFNEGHVRVQLATGLRETILQSHTAEMKPNGNDGLLVVNYFKAALEMWAHQSIVATRERGFFTFQFIFRTSLATKHSHQSFYMHV
jgi:hypothetical protein